MSQATVCEMIQSIMSLIAWAATLAAYRLAASLLVLGASSGGISVQDYACAWQWRVPSCRPILYVIPWLVS